MQHIGNQIAAYRTAAERSHMCTIHISMISPLHKVAIRYILSWSRDNMLWYAIVPVTKDRLSPPFPPPPPLPTPYGQCWWRTWFSNSLPFEQYYEPASIIDMGSHLVGYHRKPNTFQPTLLVKKKIGSRQTQRSPSLSKIRTTPTTDYKHYRYEITFNTIHFSLLETIAIGSWKTPHFPLPTTYERYWK